ncbi:predicted protein, partial [Nematostella vectensis]
VMVESPTYFHALRPVLNSLQKFEMEDFPLKNEIVHANSSTNLPAYLDSAQTINTKAIEANVTDAWDVDVDEFLLLLPRNFNTLLESSQSEALVHALSNRLAIVQGPPGCGKTFLGVKIVQLLLSLQPQLTGPVLLLTYKNHALDEFLKAMLQFCEKENIVRIGGRCKEPQLEECNLQTILKNERYTQARFNEIQDIRIAIGDKTEEIKSIAGTIRNSSFLTRESLLQEMSEAQVVSFIRDAGWNKTTLTHHKLGVLQSKKIVGVTITGASINHDLLQLLGPSVVIVEEAAEILEPSLLAALTPQLQHLILIGDHQQLRPNVDTYKLTTDFNFNVSLMERLIKSNFPYKTLAKQNRMRPEFSALLHDIYPKLEDNLPRVSQNKPLGCLDKSMFFWTHNHTEKKERTITNEKEAEMVASLVLYLLSSGCKPNEVTVLAAYLGQVKTLRGKIKKHRIDYPELHPNDEQVTVQTIDMYQGDENKYVVVSLVRCNDKGSVGFLSNINRRCVAQSRAKCGMYFVGSADTLRGKEQGRRCWEKLLTGMEEQRCVGSKITLQVCKFDVRVIGN